MRKAQLKLGEDNHLTSIEEQRPRESLPKVSLWLGKIGCGVVSMLLLRIKCRWTKTVKKDHSAEARLVSSIGGLEQVARARPVKEAGARLVDSSKSIEPYLRQKLEQNESTLVGLTWDSLEAKI